MSDGLKALSAILAEGATGALAGLDVDLFLDDEVEAFNHIKRFYRRYREFPALSVVETETGIPLTPHDQGLEYHMDRLYDRQMWNHYQDRYGALRAAISARDMEGMESAVAAMHRASRGRRRADSVYDIQEATDLVIQRLLDTQGTGGITGVRCGWDSVDEVTGGYQPADLITMVARMGVGKTYLALRQAQHAYRNGESVLCVTTEMSTEQMARRDVALAIGIDPTRLKKGEVTTRMMARIREHRDMMVDVQRYKLYSVGLDSKVSRIDALIEETGPSIVIVDGAYLLKPSSFRAGMKHNEQVGETFGELKGLTLHHNIPILATTAYNRMAGKGGKEGSVETIGFSDMIGLFSSIVIGVKYGSGDGEEMYRTRQLEFQKGREGESGSVEINYQFNPFNMDEVTPEDRPAATVAPTTAVNVWAENVARSQ